MHGGEEKLWQWFEPGAIVNWPTINTEFLWQVYQMIVATAYDYYKGLTTESY